MGDSTHSLGLPPSWRGVLDKAQCCSKTSLPTCDPAFCSILTLDAGKEPEAEGCEHAHGGESGFTLYLCVCVQLCGCTFE